MATLFSRTDKLCAGSTIAAALFSGALMPQAVLAQTFSAPSTDSLTAKAPLLAQSPTFTSPSTTILPTDVLPLPTIQNRMTFGENFQLRALQRLPARFYFSTSCETSFRYETNPFQFPTKRKFLTQLPQPPVIRQLNAFQQGQILNLIGFVNNDDMVFRVLPNVTAGWTLTPKTRLFGNYFMIRDSLFNSIRLNTVIHSISYGIQQDIPITSRANLQAEFQARELYQIHQQAVFDFLPGFTASYVLTPRTVLFANALLQMRGKKYFQAPTKEIDPFYTWGALHQRNGWTFSASSTFVQNFREPFRKNATIPVNNYAFICDFEIARRVMKQLPGLQAFMRAEPIYNFKSHNRPGLAGMDFRWFWGLRMALSKPALTATLEQLRQQLEEQEVTPPSPTTPPGGAKKPSAYTAPHEIIASTAQPIHGFLSEVPQPPVTANTSLHMPALAVAIAPNYLTERKVIDPAVKPKIASAPQVSDSFDMKIIPPFPAVSADHKRPFSSDLSVTPAVLRALR